MDLLQTHTNKQSRLLEASMVLSVLTFKLLHLVFLGKIPRESHAQVRHCFWNIPLKVAKRSQAESTKGLFESSFY